MAVALDAISNHATGDAATLSWTHTPVGTPKGILVYVTGDENVDDVTTVTYGGVAMTEVTGSPVLMGTTEIGSVHAFFLGSGIPTGPQTVVVNYGAGTSYHHGDCLSVTATGNTAIEDIDATINSGSVANPSATLVIDEDSFISEAFMSGQGAVTGITPLSGWTSRREVDWGAQCSGFYTKDANASVNTAIGWTQLADDAACIAVAIKESAAPFSAAKSIFVRQAVNRAGTY